MFYIFLSLGLGMVWVIGFIVTRVRTGGIQALALKVLAAMGYISLTLSIMAYNGLSSLGVLIVLGQIFGLLGDVFLDQKYIHKEQATAYTHLGFSVFGIGHVIYIIGMLTFYHFTMPMILVTMGIALVITVFVIATEKPFGLNYGHMRKDIILYSMIIGLATAIPVSFIIFMGTTTTQVTFFLVAMIAFLVSDLILSQIYFAKDKNKPVLIIPNYIFYFGAQYLISLSLLWL